MRFEKSQPFQDLAAKARSAERALKSGIAQADVSWMDPTRAQFEIRHLAAIHADARALKTELDNIARMSEDAIRALRNR
jgi:hypothetical protein